MATGTTRGGLAWMERKPELVPLVIRLRRQPDGVLLEILDGKRVVLHIPMDRSTAQRLTTTLIDFTTQPGDMPKGTTNADAATTRKRNYRAAVQRIGHEFTLVSGHDTGATPPHETVDHPGGSDSGTDTDRSAKPGSVH